MTPMKISGANWVIGLGASGEAAVKRNEGTAVARKCIASFGSVGAAARARPSVGEADKRDEAENLKPEQSGHPWV
jgi:hypothetical protein